MIWLVRLPAPALEVTTTHSQCSGVGSVWKLTKGAVGCGYYNGIDTVRCSWDNCWWCMMVTGSPYTMDIVDPADVEATGDGLKTAKVNRRAVFNVDVGRNGSSRDLKVDIRCTNVAIVVDN